MSKIINTALTRRNLLKYSGLTCLAIPLTRSLLECDDGLAATEAGSVTNGLIIYYPDGNIASQFFPSKAGKLEVLPEITGPLAPFKSQLSLVKGLDYQTTGSHEGGAAFCLTGSTNKSKLYSLDSFLGDQVSSDAKYRAIRLGVGANFQSGADKYVSYLSSGALSPIQDNPRVVFNDLYQVPGRSAAEVSYEQQRKKSILDFAINAIKDSKNQLGSVEQVKLDQHLTSLREMEKRILTIGVRSASCGGSLNWRGLEVPEILTGYPNVIEKNENFEVLCEIMGDMVVQALHCGLTHVALLQWSHAVSPTVFNFQSMPSDFRGNSSGHHDLSHYGGIQNQSGVKKFAECQKWYMKQVAQLLAKLSNARVGDKSLLDKTIVFATTELGDPDVHDFKDIGCLLAGGAGGRHLGGSCLQLVNHSYNHMLVTVLQLMGIKQGFFGDPQLGEGPISNLVKSS